MAKVKFKDVPAIDEFERRFQRAKENRKIKQLINPYGERVQSAKEARAIRNEVNPYSERVRSAKEAMAIRREVNPYSERVKAARESIAIRNEANPYNEKLQRAKEAKAIRETVNPKATYEERLEKAKQGRTIKEKVYADVIAGKANLKQERKNKVALRKKLQRSALYTEKGMRRFRSATAGVGSLLRAFGVPIAPSVARSSARRSSEDWQTVKRYAHAGRPLGTYKYGMPVRDYQRLMAQRKALAKLQESKEVIEMQKKGYSPEQISQVQRQKFVQEATQEMNPVNSVVEEQLQKQIMMEQVSPNTQMMLERIRRIQNKGARDNLNMQRIVRERMMVARATELLKTPSLFGPESNTMDIFNREDNIMKAENMFSEMNPRKKDIMKTNRLNILQSREAGNDLKFF